MEFNINIVDVNGDVHFGLVTLYCKQRALANNHLISKYWVNNLIYWMTSITSGFLFLQGFLLKLKEFILLTKK